MDERLIDANDAALSGWSDPVSRLRRALAQDEFALYCQPILALAGETRFPMAEVLVRLREEERALLPPGEFLPVFEHYHMMPELDRWVVRHVVKRLAAGSRVPRLTVNVSAQTLEDADFPRFVAGEVMTAGVPASALMFEIDESDLLGRPPAVGRFAAAIKSIGGGLLIDGFCRKAVSFAPLKALRVDHVKVDGCVVRKLPTSEAAGAKMSAVKRVADSIGIGVVAECVEAQDVLTRLKALGVGYAQGFGISQPQALESITG